MAGDAILKTLYASRVRFIEMRSMLDGELYHYGVKGQKHGIRRYQNEDGSLTSEGRDHYGVGEMRQIGSSSTPKARVQSFLQSRSNPKQPMTKEQKEARKRRAKKILIASAAVALTAAAAYVAHKTGADKQVINWGKQKLSALSNRGKNVAENAKKVTKQVTNDAIGIGANIAMQNRSARKAQRSTQYNSGSNVNEHLLSNLEAMKRANATNEKRMKKFNKAFDRLNSMRF